jgi:hypothetical protein
MCSLNRKIKSIKWRTVTEYRRICQKKTHLLTWYQPISFHSSEELQCRICILSKGHQLHLSSFITMSDIRRNTSTLLKRTTQINENVQSKKDITPCDFLTTLFLCSSINRVRFRFGRTKYVMEMLLMITYFVMQKNTHFIHPINVTSTKDAQRQQLNPSN